jgi:hypothetical protein
MENLNATKIIFGAGKNQLKFRDGLKYVTVTAEFRVPVAATSLLGGKANGELTKDERYAAFYVRGAINRCGRVISEK